MIRVVLRIYVLYADFEQLTKCEQFALSSVTSRYNAAMEVAVLTGSCPNTRVFYPFFSMVDIVFSLYGIWTTRYLMWVLDHGPMYHISIDDTKPLRIYTGYSTVGHPEAPPTINVVPPASPPPHFAGPHPPVHP